MVKKTLKALQGMIIAMLILATGFSTALNVKTDQIQQNRQPITTVCGDHNIGLYIMENWDYLLPAKKGAIAKYDDLIIQKFYEGTDTIEVTVKDDKDAFNFFIDGTKVDESNPYKITLHENEPPVEFALILELKNDEITGKVTIRINATSQNYTEAKDNGELYVNILSNFPIMLKKAKKIYKTSKKITFTIKNIGENNFKYDYGEVILFDYTKKILFSDEINPGDVAKGEEKNIETHFTVNTQGNYIILVIFHKDDKDYADTLQIQVKKSKINPTWKPWGQVWDGRIVFDWSDIITSNGEEGLLLDFNCHIFAFGMHHIYIEIYYLPFGKNLPEPWLHNFTFSEDCFVFLKRRFHIPITLVGHGAAVESYLWIDNRLWDEFSTEIR
ncbi:MAG: hypothetical protein J7J89_00470 [Thermoplasmata archaeon]|nr:hypothetical protein [Thermoplasmata archaeon]